MDREMTGEGEEAWAGLGRREAEVLGFVARFGVVPRDAVAAKIGTGRSTTVARERRLREAGLLTVERPLPGEPFLLATRLGLEASGHGDLFPAKVALPRLAHFSAVAHLAVTLEAEGRTLLSERELLAHERAMDERLFSAALDDGSHHRPDLILKGDPPAAVEVELSPKGSERLDAIVTAWREAVEAGRFSSVRYSCSEEALPFVHRSVDRTGAGAAVVAGPLPGAVDR